MEERSWIKRVVDIKKATLWVIAILVFIPAAYAPIWFGSGDDTGLVGHWKCEGNFVDSSGQGNHGTQSGGVTITRGAKGTACGFDGVNDDVTKTSPSGVYTNTSLTLAGWFKYASIPTAYNTIVCRRDNSDSNYCLRSGAGTDEFEFYFRADNETYVVYGTSNADAVANTWYHIAVTHNYGNASSTVVYINGAAKSGTWSGNGSVYPDTGTNEPVSIGALNIGGSSSQFFNGTLDEIRIYNRTLSATEILALYNTSKSYHVEFKSYPTLGGSNETPAPEGTNAADLYGWWKLDGDGLDSSGQANHATVYGAANTTGRWDGGYSFDAVDDYLLVTASNQTRLLSNISTISMWAYIKATGPNTYAELYSVTGGTPRTGLMWRTTGIGMDASGDFYNCQVSTTLNYNRWNHIVAEINRYTNNLTVYVNGVYIGQDNFTSYVPAATYTPRIGRNSLTGNSGDLLNGTIDEIRLYNRSLSAAEVQELYLSKGLVGKWTSDANNRNSTSTFDTSGYYNHGLITGPTLTNEGRFKEGYKFDGVNDYIDMGDDRDLEFINASFSTSAWVKVAGGQGTFRTILSDYIAAGEGGYDLYADSNNQYGVYFRNSTSNSNIATSAVTLNSWTHVATSYNRTHGFVCVNAVCTSPTAVLNMDVGNTKKFLIGARQADGVDWLYFNGTIDEVRIYNRALTASEIAGLYNGTKTFHLTFSSMPTSGISNETPAPTATDETGLVGYWKLDNYAGGNTTDSSGQGNNGSVLSTTAFASDGRWNSAFAFSGSPNAITTGITTNFSSFSVAAWFYPNTTLDAERPIVSKYVGAFANGSWTLQGNPTNTILWDINDGAQRTCSVSNVELNKWHHIVAISNVTTGTLYYDGGASTCTFSVNPISGSDSQIRIGASNVNSWIGKIDEVRIYNRSLSAEEVRDLYLSKGLVGYWKMDATQRNATSTFDSSGYYNHGIITGATLTNEGRFKEGYKFDGINDLITVSNTAPFNLTNFTLSLWMLRLADQGGDSTGYGGPFNNRVAGQNGFQFVDDNSAGGTFLSHLVIWNGTGEIGNYKGSTTYNLPFTNYKHFVWTYNGTTARLWVDGVEDTVSASGVTTYPLAGVNIGKGYGYLNGTIDEVKVYSRVLTASEIAGLYNGTKSEHLTWYGVPG